MIDLNEWRDRNDAHAWAKRLVTATNALTERIREADEKRLASLPHRASTEIAVNLTMAMRSVVRMEMRGMRGR